MTDPRGTNPAIKQDAEARPNPPRFWWLKRLSLAGLLLIVALAGLRWWWGHEAQRRIDALIADAHAKGEPILPEDFDSPGVPDAENAAIPLKQAEAGINWRGSEWNFDQYPAQVQSPPSQQDLVGIRAAMQLHVRELQLIRSARQQPGVDWGLRFPRPASLYFSTNFFLNSERSLARFLLWCAQAEHAAGNDADAIEYTRDLVFFARAEGNRAPDLVGVLVNQGLQWLASQASRDAAGSMKFSAVPSPAREDQVQALISELLDDSPSREMAARGWLGERMVALDNIPFAAKAQLESEMLTDFGLPVFQLAEIASANQLTHAGEAALQPTYPAALSKLLPQPSKPQRSALEYLSKGGNTPFVAPEIRRTVRVQFYVMTERRTAAVMLALRLYSEKHQDRLPATLKELVPHYLAAVPADPFAADGRPLGYLPLRNPPAIYSVGENGTDEGGSEIVISKTAPPWNTQDAVFPLGPDPSASDGNSK
jgi:hypothetical protein